MIPFLDVGAQNKEVAAELRLAYDRVMTRGQFILGPEVEAFEFEFASACNATRAAGVASGLDALRLMMAAYGIGEFDEVIVPSNTYIATWLAVTAVGATPVPVEPDESMNIDPERIRPAITSRTKAILAVHLYGRQANIRALRAIADHHGLILLTDAAQAHGIDLWLADAAAYSFYPTKNLGCLGDGGAVVTNNIVIDAKIRSLRNYGSTQKNRNDVIGMNSRLDELQAAFLRAKLPKLAEWNFRRWKIARTYQRELQIDGLTMPRQEVANVWHLYVIRSADRDFIRAKLTADEIETAIHYPTPPHLQPAYEHLCFKRGSFPVAEKMANEVLSLPIGPEMQDPLRVAKSIRECVYERLAA